MHPRFAFASVINGLRCQEPNRLDLAYLERTRKRRCSDKTTLSGQAPGQIPTFFWFSEG
jgi:hypothetical protein